MPGSSDKWEIMNSTSHRDGSRNIATIDVTRGGNEDTSMDLESSLGKIAESRPMITEG